MVSHGTRTLFWPRRPASQLRQFHMASSAFLLVWYHMNSSWGQPVSLGLDPTWHHKSHKCFNTCIESTDLTVFTSKMMFMLPQLALPPKKCTKCAELHPYWSEMNKYEVWVVRFRIKTHHPAFLFISIWHQQHSSKSASKERVTVILPAQALCRKTTCYVIGPLWLCYIMSLLWLWALWQFVQLELLCRCLVVDFCLTERKPWQWKTKRQKERRHAQEAELSDFGNPLSLNTHS